MNLESKAADAKHPKIHNDHLARLAYVYIRQSTPKQVSQNQGSQQYQRQLSEQAQRLGWPKERIRVIDSDLAQSARDSEHRAGFQELVAEVSLGHVGIILGYEVSRLARNNRDWYHLLDLAAVFDTLIADSDGIYHPHSYNDRLLLGLKGTMSEAELHLLKQRLEAGRLNQVKRGAYRQLLPTGLRRRTDGRVEKDPDEQVQHVLELVFKQFEQLGSSRGVMYYLRREQILLPRRQVSGEQQGEVVWKVASEAGVYDILRNPAYAGAFVYGRTRADPRRPKADRSGNKRRKQPMETWFHIEQAAYPAYISWPQYLKNQDRLHQNASRFHERIERAKQARGVARKGAALLQGLVVCGACGHHMRVKYKHASHRYVCDGLARTVDCGLCLIARGLEVDKVVVEAFFEALRPAQLDALAAILSEQQQDQARLEQQWQEQLKRARYEANLAQRQYRSVDPENRLVAAELERRWELRLRELKQLEDDYDHFLKRPVVNSLAPDLKQQFCHISETLPDLWPSLAYVQQKELLRSLISQVILTKKAAGSIEVKIIWISGHYSLLCFEQPVLRQSAMPKQKALTQTIQTLWQAGLTDKQIAAELTNQGFRSARSSTLLPLTVQKIRLKHRWLSMRHRSFHSDEVDGRLTVQGLANLLGVETSWVSKRMANGVIDPGYVTCHPQGKVYLIDKDHAMIEQLRQLLPANFVPRRAL